MGAHNPYIVQELTVYIFCMCVRERLEVSDF